MAVVIPNILNDLTYETIFDLFNDEGFQTEYYVLERFKNEIVAYTEMMYDTLYAMDYLEDKSTTIRANMIYMCIGNSFHKIFEALTTQYDPLENFFTHRLLTDTTNGSNERTGGYSDTANGKKERSYDDHGTTGMGTTFESYGDTDFRNISKTKTNGTVTDDFTNYGQARTYDNMKDTVNSSKSVSENKSGNSGIFSKQDLTTREIALRMKHRIIPIFVRMCVDVVNKGVWKDDD
jgi:hypothetical protein